MSLSPASSVSAASGGLFDAYALVQDQKASGTDGGTFTSGAWQTRVLNTEVVDAHGIVSVASNQLTLQAGSYWIVARAPASSVDRHKAKLRDITNTADLLIGSSEFAGAASNGSTASFVTGVITLAGATVIELQHQCGTTRATNGFGVKSTFSVVEVYSEVQIWRQA